MATKRKKNYHEKSIIFKYKQNLQVFIETNDPLKPEKINVDGLIKPTKRPKAIFQRLSAF